MEVTGDPVSVSASAVGKADSDTTRSDNGVKQEHDLEGIKDVPPDSVDSYDAGRAPLAGKRPASEVGTMSRDRPEVIVDNVKVTKSQSGSEVQYENISSMDLSVDLERVEAMEDCIFFDTVESIEDDPLQNLSYDKNSLLDSGINADELLCAMDGDGNSIDLGEVTGDMINDTTAEAGGSNKEDEEVEFIMKSSEMLDRLGNELKRTNSDRKYEDVNHCRKRSRSTEELSTVPSRFDFARYGISVGVSSANDLLPGIEEFLSNVLAKETLSQYAEEQRLYFLERLDIIKLPPSIPPRPQSLGIRLYPLHSSPPPAHIVSVPSADQDDFAAYQRELSRALVGDSETSPEPDEVKVYDDIDLSDISFVHEHSTVQTEEESVYEIPQAKTRNLSDSGYERAKSRTLSDSGYEKAIDISIHHVAKAVSLEALDVHGSIQPPPLPPRRERTVSDAASRSSIGSILEEKMLEISQKLGQDSHMTGERTQDTRSEKSSDDILDEGTDDFDGISYDSMEDICSLTQLSGVQLPKPTKTKRRRSVRRKMVQSLSTMKEVAVPLRNLEDILLTGELHYRSKLTWTKKIVALTNGKLICYKPDKVESRPSFMILLTGYMPTFQKREGKRNFEINLTHDSFESHVFLADFKEWAETWCEYIKYSAEGKRPPGPVLNLARGSSTVFDGQDGTYQLGKSPMGSSGSNVSLASSDGFDTDPGTVKVKKRDHTGTKTARMGSFAFRATQFFESLSKKSSVKKTSSSGSEKARPLSATLSQSSLTEETVTPLTPESGIMLESPLEVKRHIQHQGYLDIYSSFNKRKWGKRWCMVHEDSFECYRTQTSEVCELEFPLGDCVLRRAMEETKSELGLMLMENNREKITIEPMNWNELGSWLRVLMRETATSEVPDGLAGYMDDTNPYHEAVEVTRLSLLSDPFPKSPTTSPGVIIPPSDKLTVNSNTEADQQITKHRNQRNRDSGNCSSESMDGRFGSLERHQSRKSHAGNIDPGLQRVAMPDSGDIYTQIRKHSVTGALTKSLSMDQASQRAKSEGRETAGATGAGNHVFDFNFEGGTPNTTDRETEGSLMDEIMSQFRSQIPSTLEDEDDVDPDTITDPQHRIPLSDFSETADTTGAGPDDVNNNERQIVSPRKISTETRGAAINVLNVEVEVHRQDSGEASDDTEIEIRHKLGVDSSVRKTSSLLYGEKGMTEVIEELRTKLVQLKKDRISIRDRKQKVTSDIGREYLEAEYNRLNRECDKVAEEIKYLEKLQKLEKIVAGKEANSANRLTGSGEDQINVISNYKQRLHLNKDGSQMDQISDERNSISGDDNDDENITIEMVSNVCDTNIVPKVKTTVPIIATVQESIVSNDDLVHKLDIVDADVVIVEPDLEQADDTVEHRSDNATNDTMTVNCNPSTTESDNRSDSATNDTMTVNCNPSTTESDNRSDGATNDTMTVNCNPSISESNSRSDAGQEQTNIAVNEETQPSSGNTDTDSADINVAINGDNQTSEKLNSSGDTIEECPDKHDDTNTAKSDPQHGHQADLMDEKISSVTTDTVDQARSRQPESDGSSSENGVVDSVRGEDTTSDTSEENKEVSDGENGVINDLADVFEQKLRLESDTDC